MADQRPDQRSEASGAAAELARLKRALADMAAANVKLDKERKDLANKIQLAQHRYDVLAHAAATDPERGDRPAPPRDRRGAGTRTAPPPRRPPPPPAGGRPSAGGWRPPPAAPPRVQVAPLPPEASSRLVQTVMLGLSVLLLGIAAVVFVGVITDLDPLSQLAILLAVGALALTAAPSVAHRGLTATAETIAVVGLLVLNITGYALWATGAVAPAMPGPVYTGLVAGTTALVGYGYHLLTHLEVPRWTALLALQPVLPLLAYPLVTGPSGWALVFALVAAHNAALATAAGARPLGYLAWVLHATAFAVATGYATAGLILAGTAAAALPAALTLVLAAAVAVAGALGLRRDPLPDVAAGLLTLAVIVSAGRVLALALPGRALLPVAAVATVTALGVRLLPDTYTHSQRSWLWVSRRGPVWAVVVTFSGLGLLVTVLAVRTGIAALVLPPWPASLADHQRALAAVGATTAGWQLALTAAALTVGAAVAVPRVARREATVAGVALTALAAPASLGLGPASAPWVLLLAAAGLAYTGLSLTTRRVAMFHMVAATVVGLTAAGAALASPALTATILAALTVTGAVVGSARPAHPEAEPVTHWAAGAATCALPGAAGTGAVAIGVGTTGALVSAFVALCGSLGYAIATLLRRRVVPAPIQVGAGLATVAVAGFAFTLPGATPIDRGIALLLVATAILVLAAPRIDAVRRSDRLLDGADLAAAALTAGVVATLARVAALALPIDGPDAALATAATLVFVVALGVRAVPRALRRGPVYGVTGFGALVALVAGAAAVVGAAQVLAAPGPLWHTDLSRWWPPATTVADLTWAMPYALVLLAVGAALVLPRPAGSRVSAGLGVLATVAAPVALGTPWWAPAAVSVTVGTAYALSTATAAQWARRTAAPARAAMAKAATARALAAAVLGLYGVGAALVRPWTTAAVLGLVVLVGVGVAGAILRARLPATDPRLRIGGTAVAGVLLAVPAALAALGAHLGLPGDQLLLAALAGSTLGLALLATLPGRAAPYLPYGTAGVTAGATGVAFFALPSTHPAEVYAAAAALLAVLAELLRAARRPPGHRSLVRPSAGALVAAAVPAIIALVTLAPALTAALVEPYQVLAAPWQGPPAALTSPGAVGPSSVAAALLLTLAAALAAVGFGGAVTRQAVPVVAPGVAVTMLIAPAGLGAPWPAGTGAALLVFTIGMLGVALTPPPPVDPSTRPLRITRVLVLGIGLAAGGAGLAGALADPQLTWATFGGAIAVGAGAALGGRTERARLLGWLGAAQAAQLFALTTAYLLGASTPQFAFALLAVAAVALLVVARLRRLRTRAATNELMVVEWLGGYISLLAALILSLGSTPDLSAVLIGTGAVLGLAALRPGRTARWRRGLLWSAAVSEVAAWWIIMWYFEVGLLEAYTLPFAFFALLVGALEMRYRPELSSWAIWGPGLSSALVPSLVVVLASPTPQPARQAYVLLAGVATVLIGMQLRQRAPLTIGTTVTAIAALHLLGSLAGPWLVLVPLGLLLLILGANREKRQRDLDRLRGAYSRMR